MAVIGKWKISELISNINVVIVALGGNKGLDEREQLTLNCGSVPANLSVKRFWVSLSVFDHILRHVSLTWCVGIVANSMLAY